MPLLAAWSQVVGGRCGCEQPRSSRTIRLEQTLCASPPLERGDLLPLDDEKLFSFAAEYEGAEHEITFVVFMDDAEAPDVAVYAFPAFIASIEEEYTRLCEELNI